MTIEARSSYPTYLTYLTYPAYQAYQVYPTYPTLPSLINPMPRLIRTLLTATIVLWSVAPSAQSPKPWDETFRSLPQPENIKASMQRLSARPHHVGSPYDKDNAEWIQ